MPLPQPSVRSVLPLLTKSRLVEEARDFGVALAPSATKDVQIEALAAPLPFPGLLRSLGRDELRAACRAHDAERKALEAFEDVVIDRLFVLNAERAEEERKAALSLDQQKKDSGTGGAAAKPRRGRKPKEGGTEGEGQGAALLAGGLGASRTQPLTTRLRIRRRAAENHDGSQTLAAPCRI